MEIHFVTVLVGDFGKPLDFYTETLGMEISARDSNPEGIGQ